MTGNDAPSETPPIAVRLIARNQRSTSRAGPKIRGLMAGMEQFTASSRSALLLVLFAFDDGDENGSANTQRLAEARERIEGRRLLVEFQ